MEANITRFLEGVGPLLGDWKSIDLKVIASRSNDKWVYGVVKAVLDSSDPAAPTRQDLPSIDGLLVAHERWEIKKLPDLMESLSSYQLEVQGHELVVENANTSPPMNYLFESMSRRDAIQRLGISSYALYLQSWGGQPMIEGDLRLTLDTRLRVGKYPWDGLSDLLRNFVMVSPNYSSSMPTKLVEVIAPVAAWITEANLVGPNILEVEIEKSPSVSVWDLDLSTISYVAGEGQLRTRESEKTVVDETHFAFKVAFPKPVQLAVALLTYHGLDVDRVEIFGKPLEGINPRLAIVWQDELEVFLASLKDEKDKFFEDRVSILFHVLGLSPGHYGRAYQNNADIIVFSNLNDWALSLECTTREIDLHDKVSKLATRTKILTAAMPGVSIHPVLVTRFPRALVNETEKDKARAENISVVTADDFETLLRMAIDRTEAPKVRDYLLSLIPGTVRSVLS